MTEQELKTIKERCEAATPGPWRRSEGRPSGWYVDAPTVGVNQAVTMALNLNDAEFIAHARQDVTALIAEVERLDGHVAAWQQRAIEAEYDFDHSAIRFGGPSPMWAERGFWRTLWHGLTGR